jgi:ATP adenylyltransferase
MGERKGFDILWAPWRMEYILREEEAGCIFCVKPGEANDRENLILHRGETCFVIMNRYPYNNGHLMVVPFRHVAHLADLNGDERLEMMSLTADCVNALSAAIRAQGFNIGMNLGAIAGAGIDDHLHMHVVPRWEADTNFMPVIGHTKVVSEGLWETYDRLKEHFESRSSGD